MKPNIHFKRRFCQSKQEKSLRRALTTNNDHFFKGSSRFYMILCFSRHLRSSTSGSREPKSTPQSHATRCFGSLRVARHILGGSGQQEGAEKLHGSKLSNLRHPCDHEKRVLNGLKLAPRASRSRC